MSLVAFFFLFFYLHILVRSSYILNIRAIIRSRSAASSVSSAPPETAVPVSDSPKVSLLSKEVGCIN